MEACEFSIGESSSNSKFLILKQDIKTSLIVSMQAYHNYQQVYHSFDITRKQYDNFLKDGFLDHENYRYVIMQLPYFMVSS